MKTQTLSELCDYQRCVTTLPCLRSREQNKPSRATPVTTPQDDHPICYALMTARVAVQIACTPTRFDRLPSSIQIKQCQQQQLPSPPRSERLTVLHRGWLPWPPAQRQTRRAAPAAAQSGAGQSPAAHAAHAIYISCWGANVCGGQHAGGYQCHIGVCLTSKLTQTALNISRPAPGA